MTDTVVVIALVGALAGFLFLVNSLLAEGSRALYSLPFKFEKSVAEQIWDSFSK